MKQPISENHYLDEPIQTRPDAEECVQRGVVAGGREEVVEELERRIREGRGRR